MSPEEWSAEVLRREQEKPGRFPPNIVARARELGAAKLPPAAEPGPGVERLPEQTIAPRGTLGKLFNTGVDFDTAGAMADQAISAAPDRSQEPVGKAVGSAASFLDARNNSALLGIPDKLGLSLPQETPAQKQFAEQHKTAHLAGDIAGMASGGNPANAVAHGLFEAPRAATALGRVGRAAGEAGLAGGLGGGARTAVEGGDVSDVAQSAATGAGVGAVAGGALQGTIGEMAGKLRGFIREKFPEIGQAEQGGAKTNVLSGVKPGPEMRAVQESAAARGANPVDYQADLLTAPIDKQGRAELKDLNKTIGQQVRDYGASPAGAAKRPVNDLLDALTGEYASNVSRETGRPLAGSGAKLDFLRENIRDLSDVQISAPGQPTPKGSVRLSYQEALQKGYDVDTAASQLQNPAMAQTMDVVIKPAAYNAEETIQAIRNLDDRLAALRSPVGPGVAVSPKVNASAHSLTDQFPGLPELRAGHAASKGEMADKLYSAGINEKAFVGAPEQRPVFQQLLGYGDQGRQPAQDAALQELASKLPAGKRQLELLRALKAMERLKGESLPPFQIRPSGKPGLSLPKRAIATRGDPLLELLMGTPVPLGRTIGEEESR